MQRIRRRGVVLAVGEPLVALPHVGIRDQRGDLARRERGQIRFAMIARIGREHRVARAECRERLHDSKQQLLLGPVPCACASTMI